VTDPIPAIETHIPGRDGRDGLLLRVPYRSGLVEALKADLPRPRRYWDEGVGAWWIDTREEARVTRLVLHHFPVLARLAGADDELIIMSREGTGLE
jgi:hypothetical protein